MTAPRAKRSSAWFAALVLYGLAAVQPASAAPCQRSPGEVTVARSADVVVTVHDSLPQTTEEELDRLGSFACYRPTGRKTRFERPRGSDEYLSNSRRSNERVMCSSVEDFSVEDVAGVVPRGVEVPIRHSLRPPCRAREPQVAVMDPQR